jgi:hypothetical protein
MLSGEVRQTIEAVLKKQLAPLGYDHAEIIEDRDHDGDDILRITVHYNGNGTDQDLKPTYTLVRYVRDALAQLGETRFPHFRHRFSDDRDSEAA